MNSLAELFLSNNSLTILKEDTFEELISLEELEISFNKIIAINRNVFKL
jgi:Leucine-rich repeat (LRR) protein